MKTIVLGLDGASYNLVQNWLEDLPNFERIQKIGSHGKLHSTIPPITMPAWASAATGKSPESLGFFDFQKIDFQKKSSNIVKLDDWGKTIWDTLNEKKLTTAVINYPGTYPVKKLRGAMISGFLSPSTNNIYEPKELEIYLKQNKIQYKLYPDFNPYLSSELKYIENIIEITKNKTELFKKLIEKEEYATYFFGLMILDWYQHYFWKYMDPEHVHYKDSELKNIIKSGYKTIDKFLGQILDNLKQDDYLFIFSDHGFGPLTGFFHINSWLYKENMLVSQSQSTTNKQITNTLRKVMGLIPFDITGIGNRIKYRRLFEKILPKSIMVDDPYTQRVDGLDVNWQETKAFGFGYYNSVFINTKQRGGEIREKDSHLILEQLISKLSKEVESKGHTIEIFKTNPENKLNNPDLIYLIDNGEYTQSNAYNPQNIWEESNEKNGDHRKEGLFYIVGPNIKKDYKTRANIIDLAPTLEYLLTNSISQNYDGKILQSIISN